MVNNTTTCDRTGLTLLCDNRDVKLVQLRDRATGPQGPNTFNGPLVAMCAGCRKANRGQLKIVKYYSQCQKEG